MTAQILERVPGFGRLARVASAHHERLDGSGYPLGLTADELDMKVPNPCIIGILSDWCTSSQALGLEHPQLSWPIAAHEQLWWIHGRRALPEPRHERSEFQMTAEEVIGTRRVGSFVAYRKL